MHPSLTCYGEIRCETTSVPIWHPVPISRIQVKSISTITSEGTISNLKERSKTVKKQNIWNTKKIHTDSLVAADNDGEFKQTGDLEKSRKIKPITHNLFISNSEWNLNRNWSKDFENLIYGPWRKFIFELFWALKKLQKTLRLYELRY